MAILLLLFLIMLVSTLLTLIAVLEFCPKWQSSEVLDFHHASHFRISCWSSQWQSWNFCEAGRPYCTTEVLPINWRFQFNGILEIFANGNLENSLQILASQECFNDGHDIFGARIRWVWFVTATLWDFVSIACKFWLSWQGCRAGIHVPFLFLKFWIHAGSIWGGTWNFGRNGLTMVVWKFRSKCWLHSNFPL